MEIEFKDGHKIEFRKFGNIWLADSVIFEGTVLQSSLNDLRELKAKVAEWFDENAPKKISKKYKARLPLWKEIECLPFKDQIAYREGRTDQLDDYFLGDEDHTRPVLCYVGIVDNDYHGLIYFDVDFDWSNTDGVRLCLVERK